VDLAQAPLRQRVTVTAVTASCAGRRRLTELGLRGGAEVQVLRRAPFRGPLALRVGDGVLALRLDEARGVLVAPPDGRG
jgi:ferrous iron transport protein A